MPFYREIFYKIPLIFYEIRGFTNERLLISTKPPLTIRISGSAKNGKKSGIRCGFLNLHPLSINILLIFTNFSEISSKLSVDIIPPNLSGKEEIIFW
jgi:hypothetical protein